MDLKDLFRHGSQQGGQVTRQGGQGPDIGADENGTYVYFQSTDTSPCGMVLRRMPTGECRIKVWATDPNKPAVSLIMTPAGEPTLVVSNGVKTATLTVDILVALAALASGTGTTGTVTSTKTTAAPT